MAIMPDQAGKVTMEREEGYYWVGYDETDEDLQIARWDGEGWWITGLDVMHEPDDFVTNSPRLEPPK